MYGVLATPLVRSSVGQTQCSTRQRQLRHHTETPPPQRKVKGYHERFKLLNASMTPQQKRALLILTCAGCVLNLAFGVVLPTFPQLAKDLGMGASGVSLLIAVPSTARLILNLPMGRLADVWGRKPLMVVGEFLAAVGVAGTGLAATVYTLLPFRVLVGVGGAMAAAGSNAYLADLTESGNLRKHRGTIMGLQSAAFSVGWVAGPAIGGLVCDLYGPQLGFMMVGAAIGMCSIAYCALSETLTKKTVAAGSEAGSPFGVFGWSFLTSVGALLADRTQQGILLVHFALAVNYAAMTIVVPLHAAAVWGATAGQIGILFSVLCIPSLFGGPWSGSLADQHGRRAVILPSVALMAVGCAMLGGSSNFGLFFAATFIWSLGEAFVGPPLNALTADSAPQDNKGQALALSRQTSDLGYAFGPVVLGLAYDYGGAMVCMGGLGAVNAISAAYVYFHVSEPEQEEDDARPKHKTEPNPHMNILSPNPDPKAESDLNPIPNYLRQRQHRGEQKKVADKHA